MELQRKFVSKISMHRIIIWNFIYFNIEPYEMLQKKFVSLKSLKSEFPIDPLDIHCLPFFYHPIDQTFISSQENLDWSGMSMFQKDAVNKIKLKEKCAFESVLKHSVPIFIFCLKKVGPTCSQNTCTWYDDSGTVKFFLHALQVKESFSLDHGFCKREHGKHLIINSHVLIPMVISIIHVDFILLYGWWRSMAG